MKDTFDKTHQTMQNMGIDWQACVVVCTLAVLIFFVLWLLFRKLRVWYWKVDVQVNTLKSIDEHLRTLGQTVKESALFGREIIEKQSMETDIEESIAQTEAGNGGNMPEQQTNTIRKFIDLDQGISKNGTIYTEAELETLIKD